MTWLDEIIEQLDQIRESDLVDSTQAVGPGEKIAGEMTPFQKKLYSLLDIVRRPIGPTLLQEKEAIFSGSEAAKRRFIAKFNELRYKVHILETLFEVTVRDHFGLWDKITIGPRKGFLVVWKGEAKDPGSILKLLGVSPPPSN